MELEKDFSKTLIVIILLAILLLGVNVYHENKINVKKQDNEQMNDYEPLFLSNVVGGFLDVSKLDENGNPLNGVTFRLKTYNYSFEYNARRATLSPKKDGSLDGLYSVDDYDDRLSLEEVERTLTDTQRSYIHNIKTKRDLITLFKDQYSCTDENGVIKATEGETVIEQNVIPYSIPSCSVTMPTYFSLEEVKVPDGYTKKKVLVPGLVIGYYNYKNEEEPTEDSELELSTINVISLSNGYYMEYGEVEREQLLDTDLNKVIKLWERYGEHNDSCNIAISDSFLPPVTSALSIPEDPFFNDNCFVEIQNEKGNVNLIINSSVNNEESITTNVNQVLEYKVNVKNTGTSDAVYNVVTATVPTGFVYVEGSVSHNGFYHDGVITWIVDRIDKGNDIDLTFQAYAPKGVNAYQSYISEASVENDAMEGIRVESNKTYVKLSLTNPATLAPIGIIIIVLLFVGGVLVYDLTKQAKQK